MNLTPNLSSRPKHRAASMRSGEPSRVLVLALPGLAAGFSPRFSSSPTNWALAPAHFASRHPKASAVGVISTSMKRDFSPWGIPSLEALPKYKVCV